MGVASDYSVLHKGLVNTVYFARSGRGLSKRLRARCAVTDEPNCESGVRADPGLLPAITSPPSVAVAWTSEEKSRVDDTVHAFVGGADIFLLPQTGPTPAEQSGGRCCWPSAVRAC